MLLPVVDDVDAVDAKEVAGLAGCFGGLDDDISLVRDAAVGNGRLMLSAAAV